MAGVKDMYQLPPRWFFLRKKNCQVVVPETRGYVVEYGECNPSIVTMFLVRMGAQPTYMSGGGTSVTVYDPFFGHTGEHLFDAYGKYYVDLVAHDIAPSDPRVLRADSTERGPGKSVQGIFFHPPYLTTAPMSAEDGELSSCDSEAYFVGVECAAIHAIAAMSLGHVCVVARPIRMMTKTVHLDWILVDMFLRRGAKFREVLTSLPDFAFILEV